MTKLYAAIATALALALTAPAQAVPVPYANAGVVNPADYNFVAAATGDIVAYFAGSAAGYTSEIALLVNGIDTGIRGLNNHSSRYGQMLNFGGVKAGDSLVFKLINLTDGNIGPFYSDKSLNPNGLSHVYAADFVSDGLIPSGIAIGFEDLPGGGDFDYNDENFVFVNVANVADVPEPASIALLLAGVAGFAASRRVKGARRA